LYIKKDTEGSLARYIDVLMAIGDWYILFDKPHSGYLKYREAHEMMKQMNVKQTDIAEVLYPKFRRSCRHSPLQPTVLAA